LLDFTVMVRGLSAHEAHYHRFVVKCQPTISRRRTITLQPVLDQRKRIENKWLTLEHMCGIIIFIRCASAIFRRLCSAVYRLWQAIVTSSNDTLISKRNQPIAPSLSGALLPFQIQRLLSPSNGWFGVLLPNLSLTAPRKLS
jgi:hypothetical protein